MNKVTTQIDTNEILDFVEYVFSFYNPVSGLYSIKSATVEEITKAIKIYVDSLNDEITWGGGDSVDRERVRDIILERV